MIRSPSVFGRRQCDAPDDLWDFFGYHN